MALSAVWGAPGPGQSALPPPLAQSEPDPSLVICYRLLNVFKVSRVQKQIICNQNCVYFTSGQYCVSMCVFSC